MSDDKAPILVFGATGQQGGSVVNALVRDGWQVRAMVRDTGSAAATQLQALGVDVVTGDMADPLAIRRAMVGAHGVFSVQPSSPTGTLSDADEIQYGITIADIAAQTGVAHLVYSSVAAVGVEPTGMGHFDSKAAIEAHIRTLSLPWTIVRPVSFMDMLMMPGFGLDQGRFNFFQRPDQAMQFIAVEDIGKFVAAVFNKPDHFLGQVLEIAGDSVTGAQMARHLSHAAGTPIRYSRFSDEQLAASPFLAGLTALLDAGPLAGHADLAALREINPDLLTFEAWLAGPGRDLLEQALGTSSSWAYDRKR